MFDKYCVDNDKFKFKDFCTEEKDCKLKKTEGIKQMNANLDEIDELQQKLFAEKKEGIIFVFQAMDAAGKDGTIRHVLTCLSPQGVKECSFKKPSDKELAHDFLWRVHSQVPARGNIAIFNRSHYEDVLIGKVRSLYKNANFPDRIDLDKVIDNRYQDIVNFEEYLYHNGIRVVKFFLNVSKEEQADRFLDRLQEQEKNWKFNEEDVSERKYWDAYQEAFKDAIKNTATKHSPWYIIPADHKWYMRLVVSEIVLAVLKDIDPHYPKVSSVRKAEFAHYQEILEDEN